MMGKTIIAVVFVPNAKAKDKEEKNKLILASFLQANKKRYIEVRRSAPTNKSKIGLCTSKPTKAKEENMKIVHKLVLEEKPIPLTKLNKEVIAKTKPR